MAYRQTIATKQTRELRSRALIDAASAIVASDGFRAATIKAVTASASLSAGSAYTYFPTREHLLQEVFRERAGIELTAVRDAVDAAEPAGPTAQLRALVETFARRAIRGRRLAWALLVEPVDALIDAERLEYRRAYAGTLSAIIESGVANGSFAEQNPRVTGAGLVGAIGEAMTGPLSPLEEADTSPDELIESILALCIRATGAEPEGR